jgi:hypothetical protein
MAIPGSSSAVQSARMVIRDCMLRLGCRWQLRIVFTVFADIRFTDFMIFTSFKF